LNRSRTPDQLSEEVKSFWNMFSMIQFVQVSCGFRISRTHVRRRQSADVHAVIPAGYAVDGGFGVSQS
jgi:hypothetical protein